MRALDLKSYLEQIENKARIPIIVRALSHDQNIWSFFEILNESQFSSIQNLIVENRLNPGTLSLTILEPELVQSGYPQSRLHSDFLEDCMAEYESFVQNRTERVSKERLVKLAIVLIEKRKISSSWADVILEIINRMKIENSKEMLALWGTPLVIAINLINDREELLSDLFKLQSIEMGIDLLLHNLQCMPIDDEESAQLVFSATNTLPVEFQEKIVQKLVLISEKELAKKSALLFIDKYRDIDINEQNSVKFWNQPSDSLQKALAFKHIAGIAQIANEFEISEKAINISNVIMTNLHKGIQIQKHIIETNSRANSTSAGLDFLTSLDESWKEELAFAGLIGHSSLKDPKGDFVTTAYIAKDMMNRGNTGLAKNEIEQSSHYDQIRELAAKQPVFNKSWSPEDLLSSLLELNAFDEAAELSKALIEKNPSNEKINQLAGDALIKSEKYKEALPIFEWLSISGNNSLDVQRSLADCYERTGNIEPGYECRKKIIESDNSTQEDLLSFAKTAISIDKTYETFQATAKILENDPENPKALTINGLAYRKTGEPKKAIMSLEKAIDVGVDAAEPWITLSNLYKSEKNHHQAVETLRRASLSLSGNTEIQRELAETLMESGSIAEALPILNQLVEGDDDFDLHLLQADAMKKLGLLDYSEKIEALYIQHPDNYNIVCNYAEELTRQGRRVEAKTILEPYLENTENVESALLYADSVAGMDFEKNGDMKNVLTVEFDEAQQKIEKCLEINPDNTKGIVIKAEICLQKGLYKQAFDEYTNLIEAQPPAEKSLIERIQAGFALSAAFLNKFEIATTAIKQAVDSKPDWVGLRKTMAVISSLTGDISNAVNQAVIILDIAPKIVENIIWITDFLSGIQQNDEAEKILKQNLIDNPENIQLLVKLADLLISSGKEDEAKGISEQIKPSLSTELKDQELVISAKLFDRLGESDIAKECLEYRMNNNGIIPTLIDHAGYLYQRYEFDEVINQLQKIQQNNDWNGLVECFLADTLIRNGEEQKAIDVLKNIPTDFGLNISESELYFLPDQWKKIMKNKNSVVELETRTAFQLGKPEESLESAKKWILMGPKNSEAKIYAIESLLALGDENEVNEYIKDLGIPDTDEIEEHLAALKMECLLKQEKVEETQQILNDINETENLNVKLIWIYVKAQLGEIPDAEIEFDSVLNELSIIDQKQDILQIGIDRNLVKTAMRVNRWNDAIQVAHDMAVKFVWNYECLKQYLVTLVCGKEYDNSIKGLLITKHSSALALNEIDFTDELNWISVQLGTKSNSEISRWMLRGKLANLAEKDDIRAFALITPKVDDVKAMISALSLTGQTTTALQLAKKHTDNAEILFEQARIQRETDIESAIKALEQAIVLSPVNPIGLMQKSILLEKTENIDQAMSDMEQAVFYWPEEVNWRVRAAKLSESLGNIETSIDQLEEANKILPEDESNTILLGKAYLQSGNLRKCIDILEPLAKENSSQYELWEILTEAYSEIGDNASALKAAENASEINPFSTKPYLMSGRILLENGDYSKALEYAKAAVTRNNKEVDTILFLARALLRKGEKRQALAALEMVNNCPNTSVKSMIEHVNLVKEINGNASAKDLIENISSKYPENMDLLKLLAKVQEETGSRYEAEQTIQRALRIDADEPELHIMLGKINADNGQLDQAVDHLSKGVTRKSSSLDGYLTLSKVYEQQREFSKALDTLKKAMENVPGDTRSYLAAANLYKNSKDYSSAERILKKAVEIDPHDVGLRRQLGALLALNLVHQSQEVSSKS